MNLTTSNTRVNTWKSVKAQYVGLACGLALAASAVVVLSGAALGRQPVVPGTVSARSVAPVAAQRFAEQSPLRIVLVNNVEQQERLQTQFAADEYMPGYTLQNPPVVVVKGSAIEQSLLAASSETAANGRDVKVTDLTLSDRIVTPAAVVAETRGPTYESIQDYAAREQAVLDTLSKPLQLQASEADITAPMLSTELAKDAL